MAYLCRQLGRDLVFLDKGLVPGYTMRFKGGKITDRLDKVCFSLAILTDKLKLGQPGTRHLAAHSFDNQSAVKI